MTLIRLKRALGNLRYALDKAQKQGLPSLQKQAFSVADFKVQQKSLVITDISSALSALAQEAKSLNSSAEKSDSAEAIIIRIMKTINSMQSVSSVESIKDGVQAIRNDLVELESASAESLGPLPSRLPFLPDSIKADVESDLMEMRKSFDAGCYRSVVILCGRMLEVALHRKYYDATGTDLMEKAPGTGLGNLIKKLNEKNVLVDPGLANQIHLINQVRVNSVHVKKDAFSPTREQAQAVALYTIDVMKRLFV